MPKKHKRRTSPSNVANFLKNGDFNLKFEKGIPQTVGRDRAHSKKLIEALGNAPVDYSAVYPVHIHSFIQGTISKFHNDPKNRKYFRTGKISENMRRIWRVK